MGDWKKVQDVFTEKFICTLHKRMYGDTWAWAGEYRKSYKNIGIDKSQIPIAVKVLCDDALFWIDNQTFSPEEIAIRFKHRIVSIHCFPNGNGRHSRLMGDIIIEKLFDKEPFSRGAEGLSVAGDSRRNYLQALKEADQGDYSLCLNFARS